MVSAIPAIATNMPISTAHNPTWEYISSPMAIPHAALSSNFFVLILGCWVGVMFLFIKLLLHARTTIQARKNKRPEPHNGAGR